MGQRITAGHRVPGDLLVTGPLKEASGRVDHDPVEPTAHAPSLGGRMEGWRVG